MTLLLIIRCAYCACAYVVMIDQCSIISIRAPGNLHCVLVGKMASGPGAGGLTGVNIQALNNALNVFSSVVHQVASTATGQIPSSSHSHPLHHQGNSRYQGSGTSETVAASNLPSTSG